MIDCRCDKCKRLLCKTDGNGTIEIKCYKCNHLNYYKTQIGFDRHNTAKNDLQHEKINLSNTITAVCS